MAKQEVLLDNKDGVRVVKLPPGKGQVEGQVTIKFEFHGFKYYDIKEGDLAEMKALGIDDDFYRGGLVLLIEEMEKKLAALEQGLNAEALEKHGIKQ